MLLPLTSGNVILAIKEFIKVWIIQIIYYNEIYPVEIFDKVKSFDLIVFESRNPNLNKYIESFVKEFVQVLVFGSQEGKNAGGHNKSNVEGGKVNKMIVIIYDEKTTKNMREYKLNFDKLIDLSSTVKSLDLLDESFQNRTEDTIEKSSIINIPGFTWKEIYSQFKSILYLHVIELKRLQSQLQQVPINDYNFSSSHNNNNNFFRLLINVSDSIDLNFSENSKDLIPSNWIKLNNGKSDKKKNTKFIPIGEVSIGFICFDLFNEYLR